MCAIVDANVCASLVARPPSDEALPFRSWVENEGALVAGGQLLFELQKNNEVRRWLLRLGEAGRLIRVRDNDVTTEADRLRKQGLCLSNDHHVIALARVSGARLLYSRDQPLHADFTDRKLIAKPRGKVYQGAEHRHLLSTRVCRDCG